MPFKWSPRLVLFSEGDTEPVCNELKGSNTLLADIVNYDAVTFTVVSIESLADCRVDVVKSKSEWIMDHRPHKDSYSFIANDGRIWTPESEIGQHILSILEGVSIGDVTGDTASTAIFNLFLKLEVELADQKKPWLKEYFPKFFSYHTERFEKIKLKKVNEIMRV